jgi:histone-lysine N-methyltransferase SUV420H
LASDGLKRYFSGLKSDKEKADFVQHLRRYLRIYAPDCPWEVSTTNRYTIVTHEACVIARRYIKRNETIKYLAGIQLNITPEEEQEITVRKKDFSIVVSSRKKCTSLFMGPARFANHDCRANAKLMTTSHSTIEIVASRPIDVGEEITVTYSDCYFGDDNCECLCRTCEEELRNGWAPGDGAVNLKISVEEDEQKEAYSLRRRRRDDSIGGSSRTPSVTPDMRPRIYKTKPKAKKRDTQEISAIPSPGPEATPRGRKRTMEAIATPPITPAKKMKLSSEPSNASSRFLSLPSAASSADDSSSTRSATPSHADAPETDITSPEKDSPEPDTQTPKEFLALPLDQKNEKPVYQEAVNTTVEPVSPQSMGSRASPDMIRTEAPIRAVPRPRQLMTMSISSILNDPSPTEDAVDIYYPFMMNFGMTRGPVVESKFELISEPDDVQPEEVEEVQPEIEVKTAEICVETKIEVETKAEAELTIKVAVTEDKPKRRKGQKSISKQPGPPPARVRTPGDYVLTPLLLSEPDMAWIQCSNCSDYFVQQNAYFTRSSCPRCERHSKLYGYAWPKTHKAGPSDKEERILDHRMIHRFLNSNDERRARGRKLLSGSRDTTEELGAERGRTSRRESNRTSNKNQKDDDSRIRRSGRERRMSSKIAEW